MQKQWVYISSTYRDLVPYRRGAIETVQKAQFGVRAMELYGASPQEPTEYCVEDVAGCDIYLGIFAFRYGHVPKGRECSITEMEYLEACRRKLPALIFLADPAHDWPADDPIVTLRDGGDDAQRLQALRARLEQDRIVSTFTSVDDLEKKVYQALANYLQGRRASSIGPLGLAAGQCPNAKCRTIHADWLNRTICDRCRARLREPCPRCGTVNGVWSQYCGNARCAADLPRTVEVVEGHVKSELQKAQRLLESDDLRAARALLDHLKVPEHSALLKHRRALAQYRQSLKEKEGEQGRATFEKALRTRDWVKATDTLRQLRLRTPEAPERDDDEERLLELLREELQDAPENVRLRLVYLEERTESYRRLDEREGRELEGRMQWQSLWPLLALGFLIVPLLLIPKTMGLVRERRAPERFRDLGPLPWDALALSELQLRSQYLGSTGKGRLHEGFHPID